MEKKKRIVLLLIPLAALLLEALPWGVRVTSAPGPDIRVTSLHPYFSLFVAFGAAIFGALLAAVLTACLLVAALLTRKQEKRAAVPVLSVAALLAALSPLLYVPGSFTVCGGVICALLAAEAALSLLPGKKTEV